MKCQINGKFTSEAKNLEQTLERFFSAKKALQMKSIRLSKKCCILTGGVNLHNYKCNL